MLLERGSIPQLQPATATFATRIQYYNRLVLLMFENPIANLAKYNWGTHQFLIAVSIGIHQFP